MKLLLALTFANIDQGRADTRLRKNILLQLLAFLSFLASQDAQEVMLVTESLTHSWLAELTDVTLVSDDTFTRLYW